MQFYWEEIVPDLKIWSSRFPIPIILPAYAYVIPSGYWPLKTYKLSI
jgi:hypothetical protein